MRPFPKERILRFSVLLFVLIAAISRCVMDYTNHMLEVHNNSRQTISVLYSNTTPPSSTGENNIAYYIADYVLIKPDSVNTIWKNGKQDAWHNYIEQSNDKQLHLYVFSVDSLKRYNGIYSMNELCSMGKYLKVLKYSEPELIKMNWWVDYKEESPIPSSK